MAPIFLFSAAKFNVLAPPTPLTFKTRPSRNLLPTHFLAYVRPVRLLPRWPLTLRCKSLFRKFQLSYFPLTLKQEHLGPQQIQTFQNP